MLPVMSDEVMKILKLAFENLHGTVHVGVAVGVLVTVAVGVAVGVLVTVDVGVKLTV